MGYPSRNSDLATHRRTYLALLTSLLPLAGCISVNSETGGIQDGDSPDTAASTTTIEAGGGAGDALAESDLGIVRSEIYDEVNSRRHQEDGAPSLSTQGTLPEKLEEHAQGHTDVMQAAGEVRIDLEDSELLDQINESNCSVPRDNNPYHFRDEDVIIVDSIGTRGQSPGDLAEALVSRWLNLEQPRDLLLADEGDYVAVGVALRGTTLLVTVILC